MVKGKQEGEVVKSKSGRVAEGEHTQCTALSGAAAGSRQAGRFPSRQAKRIWE